VFFTLFSCGVLLFGFYCFVLLFFVWFCFFKTTKLPFSKLRFGLLLFYYWFNVKCIGFLFGLYFVVLVCLVIIYCLLFKIGSTQSINVQQIAFGLFKSVIIILFGLLLGCVCFWGNVIVSNKPYMSTVKFILSKSQHQRKVGSKSSMVMLRYTHNKQSALFVTHKNIDDDCWDFNNQCAKKSYPSHLSFNTYLRTFKQKVDDIVNQCFINSQDPTTVLVKQLFVQQQ